jgi:1,4-alpha-glucan branching enzyme
MLAEAHVQALLAARHPDPFSVLGLHLEDDGELWLRVCWPSVAAIDVLDAKTGR